jgi:hypothetical protein
MVEEHWIIEVPAWGTHYGIGTEDQAEEWRKHKARWEQSIARKRRATLQEIEDNKFEAFN